MSQFFFLVKLILGVGVVALMVYFCVKNQEVVQVYVGPLAPLRVRVYLLVLIPFFTGCLCTALYVFLKSLLHKCSQTWNSAFSSKKDTTDGESSLA